MSGKRKIAWLIGGLLVVAGILAWSLGPSQLLPRATWLWDTAVIEQEGADVIEFLQQEEFAVLYLQINPNVKEQHYRSFIQSAGAAGISVHALDGAPDWAAGDGKAKSDLAMQWLAEYQQAAAPEERFHGVHLDVEPYLLPEWKTNKQLMIENYQQIINNWSEFAKSQKIVIGLDIPFWYDEERMGQMSLFEWLYGAMDQLTIMSYRNQIEGENGVLDITAYEREMSKKVGKPLYLALETEPSREGPHLAFDSYSPLMAAVRQLEAELSDGQGIAIHHYERYRQLQKQADKKQP